MLISLLGSSDYITFDESSAKCWCQQIYSKWFFVLFSGFLLALHLFNLASASFLLAIEVLKFCPVYSDRVAVNSEEVFQEFLTDFCINFLHWHFVGTCFLAIFVLFRWDWVSINFLIANCTTFREHFTIWLIFTSDLLCSVKYLNYY